MEKLHASDSWEQLRTEFHKSGDASSVIARLSTAIEGMAVEAYETAIAPSNRSGVAMLAVGGFGRRELFPYSDVDILLLLERESQTASLKDALSEFVRLLWDAGLRLSHSVRTIVECTTVHEQNIELNISLLDRRLLAGDADAYAKLESKLPAFEEKQARLLMRHLRQLARTRHAKYQDTFYHLEPDVKETPGGLRDLHLIGWLNKLRKQEDRADCLAEPVRFLQTLRCFLHYQAQRDQNLLNFEAQEEATKQSFISAKEPPTFMRQYFQNARAIYSEARRALDLSEKSESSLAVQFRDWRSRLSNRDFTVSNERVYLKTPGALESDPAIVLRLFEFVARHGIPLAAETERRLEERRAVIGEYLKREPKIWPAFRDILSNPHAAQGLRAMHNTGLLQVLFPEWATIVCLVVPDYYHRYTVDEHTLITIEKVEQLSDGKDESGRRFAEILSEIPTLALLRFALLFHDAGKGADSGDHAKLSVELAHQAMERIGVPPEDRAQVEFLIEHHLDLSAVMNSRDLHDPATARMLADRIGTIERLKLLAVLTYADISAVNPGAMTPWRLEQLWEAYRVTHQELVRELETDRIQDVPQGLPEPASFIKGFPVRYLRTHTPEEIQAHAELRELSRPTGVAVHIERQSIGVYGATIVARDKPFLFASLAGVISSFGMDILRAEAFANAKGTILDTFAFADPKRTLELNPIEVERLQETMERVALGKVEVETLLRGRPAQPKRKTVRPSVHFDSNACETATLVEIIAEDRPRLLYDLASTFSSAGCNIDVVLIDTEGRKAIDVFYVASDGRKLTADLEKVLEKKLLAVC